MTKQDVAELLTMNYALYKLGSKSIKNFQLGISQKNFMSY